MAKRVVLAYSGGLDTSVAVRWMREELDCEVIALAADVGQGGDWDAILARAAAAGAVDASVVDVRQEYAEDFVAPALKANAKYEGKYPLISSLSRPVIVKHLVATARRVGADAIAHGCTGKGNDQVRFEVSTRALAPDLDVIAPVRGWGLTREQSIEYAQRYHIPITVTKASPYSHRPEPVGTDHRMRDPRGSVGGAAGGRLRADHAHRDRTHRDRHRVRGRPARLPRRPTAPSPPAHR